MVLTVDGVSMPTPKQGGLTISKNKVWSRNAGRNDNATMVGTIIAFKTKLTIEWPPLTADQSAVVDSSVSSGTEFHSVQYTGLDGETHSMTAYWGDGTYPVYSMNANGQMILSGVKADLIEQ